MVVIPLTLICINERGPWGWRASPINPSTDRRQCFQVIASPATIDGR